LSDTVKMIETLLWSNMDWRKRDSIIAKLNAAEALCVAAEEVIAEFEEADAVDSALEDLRGKAVAYREVKEAEP